MKMRKLAKKQVAAFLVVAFMTTPLWSVYGEDDDLQNQLQDVGQQMQSQQDKKSKAEVVIGSVSAKLKEIQDALNAATAELKSIEKQQKYTEEEIVKNEILLKKAEEELAKRQIILDRRIRDIYVNGQLSYIDVVLGAKDFNDFANRVQLLRRIISSDMDIINAVREERSQIEATKATLEADREKILELKKNAAEKQAEIKQKRSEQQFVLDQAQNDKSTAEAAYAELQASSAEITRTLQARAAERAAQAAAAASAVAAGSSDSGGGADTYQVQGSGQFIWPVNGPVTSPFGYRMHPIFGRMIGHTGIDIGVDSGTPVHAADSGTVVDAGWMGGYGYAVLIDHGNGFATLYGHNERVIVSAGQHVSQGQVISYSGSTGNSTGPHVHFEVRLNGVPVDPMGYL
jgi:murein DD-endopeptidase MepM/ murein hydrolase activator NlpD